MKNFGYIKSAFDVSDKIANPVVQSVLPKKYDLSKELPGIRDQGNIPKCVSCSVTDMLFWRLHSENRVLTSKDDFIFNKREDKNMEGMTPKEAFEIAKKIGVSASGGNFNLKLFARVGSADIAKKSIFVYGPVLVALPCYDEKSNEFWVKSGKLNGGHAVTLVGWDIKGFILRNSWGRSYGNGGYFPLPFESFNQCLESWVLIS